MIILENRYLSVRVKEIGAELCGIYDKQLQKEYMWQPGYEIWDHSSLILFPNTGRISRDRVIIGGKTHPATMHGFAWRKEFHIVSCSSEELVMELYSDNETRVGFPYEFTLQVIFRLESNRLVQHLNVINRDSRRMYFCLGAHPGFYLPLELGESGEDYLIRFDKPQRINRLMTQDGTMLLTGERRVFMDSKREIQLSENFFNNGPLLLEGLNAGSVMLLSKKSGRFVQMGIQNFPYMPSVLFHVCMKGTDSELPLYFD